MADLLMLVRTATLSLTRVALLKEPPQRPPTDKPRLLRRATERARGRLSSTGLLPDYTATVDMMWLQPKPGLMRGLGSATPPQLVVSEYGLGFISARVRLTVHPNRPVERLAERWSTLAKWAARELDRELERREGTSKSRRFSVVNIVEGPPLDSISENVLLWLAHPMLGGLPSREFARRSGRRESGLMEGDSYFLCRTGAVVAIGAKRRSVRKRMRKMIHTALDMVLALEAAVISPPTENIEGSDWVWETAMLHLSPGLWASNRLIWDSPFYSSYARLERVLGAKKMYEEFCKSTTSILTPEQFERLSQIREAAKRLRLSLPIVETPEWVSDDESKVLKVIALKEAIDRSGRGDKPSYMVNRLSMMLRGLDRRRKWEIEKRLKDREDRSGLTCPELSYILNKDQKTLKRILDRLVDRGMLTASSTQRKGKGRGTVRFYRPTKAVEPLVVGWASKLVAQP